MFKTFQELWNSPIGILVKVSNGEPPPSNVVTGIPYKQWKSHNFVGTFEEAFEETNWRYLKFALRNEDTPDNVEYMAYHIAEGGSHTFELV